MIWILLLSFIGIIKGQTDCGADCSLCNNATLSCESADQNCRYLPDNQICALVDTCRSDCTFCGTDATACVNEGAGGGGVCFIATTGPNTGSCIGNTCDTNCVVCNIFGDPNPCLNSAAPGGCVIFNGERCQEDTPVPTMDPTEIPSTNPSQTPTTSIPTTVPTDDPTTAQPTLAPTQQPIVCGESRTGFLVQPQTTIFFPLIIDSDDYAFVTISTCPSIDYDNTLALLDSGDNQIAFDDDSCGTRNGPMIDIGASEIVLSNPDAGDYTIVLDAEDDDVEGTWVIEIICDTFAPSSDPTDNPSDVPTTNPSGVPTSAPTTASPTTADPTTASPTTATPTTADPTTDSPTTASPTTASPTTADPTTADPTTAEPTTAEPTTDSPTTGEPTTAEPTEPETTTTEVLTTTEIAEDCPDCPYNITITRIGDIEIEPCPTESPTPSPITSDRKSYWNNRYNKYGGGNWRRRRLTEREEDVDDLTYTDLRAQKQKDRRRLWGGRNNKDNKAWNKNNNKNWNNWNKNNNWNKKNNRNKNNNWNKNNNYNNNWNNKQNNYNNNKYSKKTPSPTVWIKDRICIDPNEETGSDRRRLWGYRDRDKDGCNDDEPTPQPTEEPDGFEQWYKEKCPAARDSSGWDSTYDSHGYGSSKKKSSSKFSSRYTSWSKRKDESDEFITEVCVTYTIDVPQGGVDQPVDEDCVDLESVFLGLCENENTDFNSSTLNTDDLEGLIISINGNSSDILRTNSGDGIKNISGAVDDDGRLGVLITFEDDISDVTTFELCLGNVTVDVDFNDEKDLIEFGNGTITANGEECTSDGLPCLNFFFDIPCPPETTDDGRDCTCQDGINTLTVRYDNVNGYNADIAVYRYRGSSSPICEFTDVAPGDELSCSDTGRSLRSNTYFTVNYNDVSDRRRRSQRRRMTYYGKKSSYISGDCVGRFITDCGVQLIGLTAYGCDDLTVTSYVDEEGQYCDATVLADADDGSDYNYAFINAEDAFETPLQVLDDLDPYVKYSLLGVMITFLLLSFVACYICVARGSQSAEDKKKNEIEKAIELAQIDKAKANQRAQKYEARERKLKKAGALSKVKTGEDMEDDEDDDEYYDEDEEELDEINEVDEEEQFYDDEDMDNMDVLDGNEDQYVE